jgi:putative transcriptional regulator
MIDPRAIRLSLNLTQDQFAERFHLSVATIRAWEQQRRPPSITSQILLAVIAHAPAIVDEALKSVR